MSELEEVLNNCKIFTNILKQGEKGCFLIRAVSENDVQIKLYEKAISERKPRDMPQNYHDEINKHFEKIFGWPVRNGIFSFGVKKNISSIKSYYGTNYLLFPCGEFKYVYDFEIHDLYGHLFEFDDETENRKANFINSINYVDTNLIEGMSKVLYDGKSAEIIINCKSYYLIHHKYTDELIKLIWT